jgi:hypothetical protein
LIENLLNEIDTLAKKEGLSIKKEVVQPSSIASGMLSFFAKQKF